jgi:hypothetical protein
VEQVESFKFLGVHITKLSWFKHTKTVVKRAQQSLFPLRRLKRLGMAPKILKRLYSFTIENILTGMRTAQPRPQGTTEGSANAANIPAIQNLYTRRYQRKTLKMIKDSSQPSYKLFSLLLHCKRHRSAVRGRARCGRSLMFDPAHQFILSASMWAVSNV